MQAVLASVKLFVNPGRQPDPPLSPPYPGKSQVVDERQYPQLAMQAVQVATFIQKPVPQPKQTNVPLPSDPELHPDG